MTDWRRAADVTLSVEPAALDYEEAHEPAIDAHWRGLSAANASLFDGHVYLATECTFGAAGFAATCRRARFATLLHWRDNGRPAEAGFRNIFASAAIRTEDGAFLLGEMGPASANAGKVYFPAGGFDDSDRAGDHLDAASAIARECGEETGLGPDRLTPRAGFWVDVGATAIAVLRVYDIDMSADALLAERRAWLAAEIEPELSALHVAHDRRGAEALDAPDYICRFFDAHDA